MTPSAATDRSRNALLAALSRSDFRLLAPALETVALAQSVVMQEVGDAADSIWFPHSGMVSLLAVVDDGKAIEVATIGREGSVGMLAGLSPQVALGRAVVQLPFVGDRMTAAAFRTAASASRGLRDLAASEIQVLLTQVQTTAACNALHRVDARLCRWILQSHDRGGGGATIRLTQAFLSEMLGVRRSSVSEVAGRLQSGGLIRYSRGAIEILDRSGLEAQSCACYRAIRAREAALRAPRARG